MNPSAPAAASPASRTETAAHAATRQVFLVLPAYNEAESLPPLFERIAACGRDLDDPLQVVLVDDGSVDNTVLVAEEWRTRLPVEILRHTRNSGLGQTIRDGLLRAAERAKKGDVIVTMDADDTQPPDLVPAMLEKIDAGNDVVIASRYRRGARVDGLSWPRRLCSFGAGLLFRAIMPLKGVRDYTCGFRAYSAESLQNAIATEGENFCARQGFECMVDLLLTMSLYSRSMAEVPMVLRYDQKRGASKMRVGRTIRSTLRLLVEWRLGRRSLSAGEQGSRGAREQGSKGA